MIQERSGSRGKYFVEKLIHLVGLLKRPIRALVFFVNDGNYDFGS